MWKMILDNFCTYALLEDFIFSKTGGLSSLNVNILVYYSSGTKPTNLSRVYNCTGALAIKKKYLQQGTGSSVRRKVVALHTDLRRLCHGKVCQTAGFHGPEIQK